MDAPEVRHSVCPIGSSSDAPEMLSLMAALPPIKITNTNRYGVVTRYEEDHFGRKQGRFTEHNHRGEPLSECFYKDDKSHGQYTRWGCGEAVGCKPPPTLGEAVGCKPPPTLGQIHLVRERYNYTDGVLDGLYEKFHHNGSIEKRMTYKSGHITGRIQTWDKNGRVIEDWDYPLDIPF